MSTGAAGCLHKNGIYIRAGVDLHTSVAVVRQYYRLQELDERDRRVALTSSIYLRQPRMSASRHSCGVHVCTGFPSRPIGLSIRGVLESRLPALRHEMAGEEDSKHHLIVLNGKIMWHLL